MKEKSFAKERELLDAALEEFTTKSYDEASLNNIIKNARISKGTFYYHFRDKKALYLYLLQNGVKAKWEFINNAAENTAAIPGEQDIFESFKFQARIGARFAQAFPKYHLLSKMFAKEKGNKIYEVAKNALRKDGDDSLETTINAAIGKGAFRPNFSRDFIVRIITHMFASFDEIFHEEEDFELGKMIRNLDDYVDFMKYGLGRD